MENYEIDSILTSIKKQRGIIEEDEHFDPDLILDINTAFAILTQIGVGPEEGFYITDKSAVWTDFIPDGDPRLNTVKSFVDLTVYTLFDPPSSSSLLEAINKILAKLEWRIQVTTDTILKEKGKNQNGVNS